MKKFKTIVSVILAIAIASSIAVCAFGADVIGTEKAKTIALEHSGVAAANAVFTSAKLEYDDGIRQYEIDFRSAGYEYDYEINAYTGTIISFDKELCDNDDICVSATRHCGNAGNKHIGSDAAKQAALAHAGIDAANALYIKAEFDCDNGVAVYDVEFHIGEYEYDYEINACTGDVISYSKEYEGKKPVANTTVPTTENSVALAPATSDKAEYIGVEKAKEIALEAAGLNASQVKFRKARLDYDDGVAQYDIEFRTDRTHEYDYEIDALTGEITDYDFDIESGFNFRAIFSFFGRLFGRK